MKYASLFFVTAFFIFFGSEIHNLNIHLQESFVKAYFLIQVVCLKLKQQSSHLNINCEDLLNADDAFPINTKYKQNEEEINKIERLENMIQNLSGSVETMNEELKKLKNSVINKNTNNQNSKIDREDKISWENINKKIIKSSNQQKSVLKMKTFNDLQLDLNSLKINEPKK